MRAMADASSAPPDLEAAWLRFGDQLRRWLDRRLPQTADAEDVLQQVFLKLAERPPRDLPEERIGAWLFRVARNAMIDARRRATVRTADVLEEDTPAMLDEDGARRSLSRCLEPMLRTLPDTYAEAVRGADLEGRSQRDLAEEAGVGLSAMKSRVQRGRKLLRDNLVACCNPDADLDCRGCDEDSACR